MKIRSLLAMPLLFLVIQAWGTMTPQYSSYTTRTADQSYLYVSAVVDGTTTGCNLPPYCIGYYHQGKIYLTLGSTGGWVTGTQTPPPNYLSVTNAKQVAFVEGDPFLNEDEEIDVYCSGLNQNIFSNPFQIAQVEVAFTQAYWSGSPPPTCGGTGNNPCIYLTSNHCTPATNPPDDPISSVLTGDYRGIATWIAWRTIAPCIRFSWPGPWGCGPPLAFKVAMNEPTYPRYACTHNP